MGPSGSVILQDLFVIFNTRFRWREEVIDIHVYLSQKIFDMQVFYLVYFVL